jgi:molecular chaperone GrpE
VTDPEAQRVDGSVEVEETSAEQAAPTGEGRHQAGSFGDAAAEMANETEVETVQSDGEPGVPSDVPSDAEPDEGEPPSAEQQLAERTADLQRLQAEYVNYKRRVERDRDLVRENATYQALTPIIEVLDNIDRAREHGPLEEGFRSVAEQLERVVAAQGLTRFGEPGDAFDPTIHEALSHIGQDPDVEVTTCKVIAKAGYRMGERVVRAAQVLVVDPGERDEAPSQEM